MKLAAMVWDKIEMHFCRTFTFNALSVMATLTAGGAGKRDIKTIADALDSDN